MALRHTVHTRVDLVDLLLSSFVTSKEELLGKILYQAGEFNKTKEAILGKLKFISVKAIF